MTKRILFSLFFLVSILPSLAAQQKQDRDWAQFGRYQKANETVTVRPKAVLMGDSITDGWAAQDPDWLSAQGFAGRGISGQTTSEMLVRFRADVIGLKPRYVVILAGINDIARNNGFIEVEHIFGNIVSMAELAKVHKIKPVLCTVLPASEIGWRKDLGDPTPKILQLNALLKDYARRNRIPFVDYYTPMVTDGGALNPAWAKDAVHPNLEGYHKMEEILLKSVKFK